MVFSSIALLSEALYLYAVIRAKPQHPHTQNTTQNQYKGPSQQAKMTVPGGKDVPNWLIYPTAWTPAF